MSSPVVRKYGNITVPLPGEVPDKIGHAVALVGYEDSPEFAGGGYFIVRNSWGYNWATEGVFGPGYGTIPYRYIERFNWDAWCVVS
jgi:C1A family cysteine protease